MLRKVKKKYVNEFGRNRWEEKKTEAVPFSGRNKKYAKGAKKTPTVHAEREKTTNASGVAQVASAGVWLALWPASCRRQKQGSNAEEGPEAVWKVNFPRLFQIANTQFMQTTLGGLCCSAQ
jgi:hypothetical protein